MCDTQDDKTSLMFMTLHTVGCNLAHTSKDDWLFERPKFLKGGIYTLFANLQKKVLPKIAVKSMGKKPILTNLKFFNFLCLLKTVKLSLQSWIFEIFRDLEQCVN